MTQLSPRSALAVAFVVLIGIAGIDWLAGAEVRITSLYLIPILIATWNVGKEWGYGLTVVSLILLFAIEQVTGAAQGRSVYFYIDVAGRLISFCVIVALASRLRSEFEREKQLARTDGLTRLMNRRAFYASMEAELARRHRQWQPFAVLYMDCDNFKRVNDTLGHHEGDRLLRLIADTLKRNVRRGDLVARLGGDEFAIFFPNDDDNEHMAIAIKLSDKLTDAICQRYPMVTFSMGIAVFRQIPPSLDAVIAQADRLMYAVKGSGKNGVLEEVF